MYGCEQIYAMFMYSLQSGDHDIDIDNTDGDNPFNGAGDILEDSMQRDRDAVGSDTTEQIPIDLCLVAMMREMPIQHGHCPILH